MTLVNPASGLFHFQPHLRSLFDQLSIGAWGLGIIPYPTKVTLLLTVHSLHSYSTLTPSLLCFFGQRIRDPVLHALKATRTYLGTALASVALAFVQCPVFTLCATLYAITRLLVLLSTSTWKTSTPEDYYPRTLTRCFNVPHTDLRGKLSMSRCYSSLPAC